jgi:trk system potassium uptake protein TrkH
VSGDITYNILAFIMIYVSIFAFGSLVLALVGVDFMTAIGAVATCLGNTGPGIGSVGPVNNFAHLPQFAKVFLGFLMLVGRLELFTILMILTPYFWRKY